MSIFPRPHYSQHASPPTHHDAQLHQVNAPRGEPIQLAQQTPPRRLLSGQHQNKPG